MAIIQCKVCGGEIALSADKTFGTCEYCGTTSTFPKVSDEQRAAAFNRGNHFRRIGEFDKALAVYERIVQEDDQDAEAHWCCALCRFGIEYVEDPATYEWLPTCHRASFDSFLEDVDYKAALENSDGITRRQYLKDAAKIAEVQRGILAASQNTEPYDVFICYKESDEKGQRTRDSLLAQDIYYQLTEQGRKVFFARITLEDVVGTQYEPYIFAALNSAKVMVVVGTRPEHLHAVWVKNEWSRFLAMMKKDRHKLLLPCYRDMDPYDMPEALSVLQSYDMSKIGFIQDLTRGIAKVLDAEKKPQHQERIVVQQQEGTSIDALLKRGYMALEDSDWSAADQFFEKVLNHNAELSDAYLGKALAQLKQRNLDELIATRLTCTENATYSSLQLSADTQHVDNMLQYAVPPFQTSDNIRKKYEYALIYPTCVTFRETQRKDEENYWKTVRNLARALYFSNGQTGEQLTQAYTHLLHQMDARISAAKEEECRQKELLVQKYRDFLEKTDGIVIQRHSEAVKKRDSRYQSALEYGPKSDNISHLEKAKADFLSLGEYKDCPALASQCQQKINQIQHQARLKAEQEQAERQRKIEHQIYKNYVRKRRLTAIAIVAAIICICLAIWACSSALKERGLQRQATLDEVTKNLAGKEFSASDSWTGNMFYTHYRNFILEFHENGTVSVYHKETIGPMKSHERPNLMGTYQYSLHWEDGTNFSLRIEGCKYSFTIVVDQNNKPLRLIYDE